MQLTNMPESNTSPRRIAAVERQLQALELRKTGASYASVAKQLDYRSPQAAYEGIKSALRRTVQEPSDEVRQLELERLDTLLSGLWDDAQRGDCDAIDRVLKIMARRAEYLGLNQFRPPAALIQDNRSVTIIVQREGQDPVEFETWLRGALTDGTAENGLQPAD